jgi:hypothetical protein
LTQWVWQPDTVLLSLVDLRLARDFWFPGCPNPAHQGTGALKLVEVGLPPVQRTKKAGPFAPKYCAKNGLNSRSKSGIFSIFAE